MKHFLVVLAIFCMVQHSPGQTRSGKRGVAYGENSKQDLQALSAGISWWYNWYHQPEPGVINDYKNMNVDYVTMAWNKAFNKTAMRSFLLTHPDVKYILGWNEPNFIEQANMTPSDAAAQWKDIEALATEFNLKIGSPAVNFCGNCVSENGTTYTDPVKYLDDFFAACKDCRVDFIAIHCYMNHVSALQWYVSLFEKYNKPIWLTEFCAWENSPTLAEQTDYMIGAVDYLENNPKIERYAWFTGRSTGVPYNTLLEKGSGALSDLGSIYVNMPVHNTTAYIKIPARIEAEAYTAMNGISLEATQDVTGTAHVTAIESGDWLDYNIDVSAADTYPLRFRVASKNVASIKIMEGAQTLLTVSIPDGKDITKWQTVSSNLKLSAGRHTLRLQATAAFNFNWFDMGNQVVANEPEPQVQAEVYPNPIEETLFIANAKTLRSAELLTLYGQTVYSGPAAPINCSSLDPGLYILKLTSLNGSISTQKIIKK